MRPLPTTPSHYQLPAAATTERGAGYTDPAAGEVRVMGKRPNESAGLLLFRRRGGRLEVFLAHPGGRFWANRDAGAWTIPKGLVEPGEDPLAAARREFEEETGIAPDGPFLPLGSVRQR